MVFFNRLTGVAALYGSIVAYMLLACEVFFVKMNSPRSSGLNLSRLCRLPTLFASFGFSFRLFLVRPTKNYSFSQLPVACVCLCLRASPILAKRAFCSLKLNSLFNSSCVSSNIYRTEA